MQNNKSKRSKDDIIIQLRNDVFVNKNNIDLIIKTNVNPKDGSTFDTECYLVYLKNSKYNWVQVSENEFNTYIKKYL